MPGVTCMNWISKGKYVGASYVKDFGTGDHNYCRYHQKMCWVSIKNFRNPSNHDNPWCYKESDGSWEDCKVPLCSSITTTPSSISSSSTASSTSKPGARECLEDAKGKGYRGTVSETASGKSSNFTKLHTSFFHIQTAISHKFKSRCLLYEMDLHKWEPCGRIWDGCSQLLQAFILFFQEWINHLN